MLNTLNFIDKIKREHVKIEMKKRIYHIALGLATVAFFAAVSPIQLTQALKIGDKAPKTSHRMEDTSGRSLTLADATGAQGLLVLFTGNTCPWVARWEDRYAEIASLAAANGIGVIALNSNERIRNRGEGLEDMKRRSKKQNYSFTYALDEDHIIADAFGATKNPEVFLFNASLELVYHGAIDDNPNNANAVKNSYVPDAIRALSSGSEIKQATTKLSGCPIKRSR